VRDPSDRGAWERLVDEALTSIEGGSVDKLVLAREVVVHGRRSFDVRTVLLHLLAVHDAAWVFLVRGRQGDAFLGASPETLCVVADGRLRTEALAGTSRDDAVATLASTKERHEHALVVDGIRASLRPYVRNFEAAALPALKSQGRLRHLHTPVSADLLAQVEPTLAARALHPTPAVAGSPARTAVDWLAEREGFVRGWYAGAVGVRGDGSLHLAVAIRSALVHGRTARVFVGAGVVPGSLAEREWEETELKASVMLRALGVAEGE
jgi:salicylate biosynthesis isochorismate synthase/menaquinone-specific isochorismate synthase